MKVEIETYEFNKELFFYDLVTSFSISLCGCPVIFEEDLNIYHSANQVLSFPGAFAESKHMVPFRLRQQASKGDLNKSRHIASCCMMLANTAYESVKNFNDGSEVFEFFRHIRNASSHLNSFQFNHKEPAHPAKWRGAIIDEKQKGENNPLFGQSCFGRFIGVADILDLLMDIERKIILSLEDHQ